MGRHTARVALLASGLIGMATAGAQTTTDNDQPPDTTAPPDKKPESNAWGVEEPGGYVAVGAGEYSLHWRAKCPAYNDKTTGDKGCTGTEILNYQSPREPLALSLDLGWRFSRYLSLEVPLQLLAGRANDAPKQSVLDQGAEVNAILDVGLRLRATLPLPYHFALFGTVGVQDRSLYGTVNQPVGTTQTCVQYGPIPNPSQPPGPGNYATCEAYQYDRANTPADTSSVYFPVSAGVEWWPFQHTGFTLGYQPPMSRGGITTSQIMLRVVANQ